MTPDYWEKGKRALSKRDPILKAIIKSYHGEAMQLRGDPFFTLARAIVGQQISVKAADSIWNRVVVAVGKMTPMHLANTPSTVLRPCGLSDRKVIYLHSLANHFIENEKRIKNWPKMTDEEVIQDLIEIKGIGRWTAEMLLIFGLGRPDVFPLDDLGLLKGIYRHYNKGKPLPKAKLLKIGESWRPYRSIGTWYMWRVLDPVPVAY